MQPIFKELETLVQEKRTGWLSRNTDSLALRDRENICVELRIMHIAVLLFTLATATCAFSLTACGIIVPILTGHIITGCARMTLGIALGLLAYDLNNLREIVYKMSGIFEDYVHLHKKNEIKDAVREGWEIQNEMLQRSYNNLFVVHNLLDTVWPLTTRAAVV